MNYTLYSIAFSHYVEKARWALDRFQVPYAECRLMPLFHMPAVVWATRGQGGRSDKVSSRFSTPLLISDDGFSLQDSSEIVRWVSDQFATSKTNLYPTPEVAEIEQYLHDKLGAHTRLIIYYEGLQHRDIMIDLAKRNTSPFQAQALKIVYPVYKKAMFSALAITSAQNERSLERVRTVFDAMETRRNGRPWLVGDHLTAADIAYACMASPVLMPGLEHGYGAHLPSLDELPPRARALVEEFRDTPTGRYVLNVFKEHRKAKALPLGVR